MSAVCEHADNVTISPAARTILDTHNPQSLILLSVYATTYTMNLRILVVSLPWSLLLAVRLAPIVALMQPSFRIRTSTVRLTENTSQQEWVSRSLPVLRVSTLPTETDELPSTEDDVQLPSLSPKRVSESYYNVEKWCVDFVQKEYVKALSIKCPFFRRRATDFVEGLDILLRAFVVQHKGLLGSPPGWRCEGDTRPKALNLPMEELLETIRQDWCVDTDKGYYITGRLNTSIYRDYCLFDGPDPDMPVRGLRKYLSASSNLFDQGKSRAELLSLEIKNGVIVAQWRMNGMLRLPWRPRLPEVVGTTTYHTDSNGLIYRHEESWDMPVLEAFLRTFFPETSSILLPEKPKP